MTNVKHEESVQDEIDSSFNLVNLAEKRKSEPSKAIEGNNDGINRLVRNDGKADEINAEIMESIKSELHDKAQELAEQHGLSCARILDGFDSGSCDVNLKFSVINLLGQDVFTRLWFTNAEKYGLHAKHLGQKFIIKDTECMVTGLDDTDPDKPLVRLLRASDTRNKTILVDLESIKRILLSCP